MGCSRQETYKKGVEAGCGRRGVCVSRRFDGYGVCKKRYFPIEGKRREMGVHLKWSIRRCRNKFLKSEREISLWGFESQTSIRVSEEKGGRRGGHLLCGGGERGVEQRGSNSLSSVDLRGVQLSLWDVGTDARFGGDKSFKPGGRLE